MTDWLTFDDVEISFQTLATCSFFHRLLISRNAKEDGWVAKAEGEALIELVSYGNGVFVPIVRFVNDVGKDGLRCQILKGLPLLRFKQNTRDMFFKTVSTTPLGAQVRTSIVFALQFARYDGTDDFQRWLHTYN